jgi:hypothetical protein
MKGAMVSRAISFRTRKAKAVNDEEGEYTAINCLGSVEKKGKLQTK